MSGEQLGKTAGKDELVEKVRLRPFVGIRKASEGRVAISLQKKSDNECINARTARRRHPGALAPPPGINDALVLRMFCVM